MMKINLICLLLWFFNSEFLIPQNQDSAIVLHPIIGTILDRVEEEYFSLLPTFTNVQEAVFYLNPDSSLNVRVKYEHNKALKDTLVEGYQSYLKLNRYIKYKLADEYNNARKVPRGKYAAVLSKSDSTTGELIAVNRSSITLLKLDRETYYKENQPPFHVRRFKDTNVNKLIIFDESNPAKIIYPVVLAAGLGLTGGIIAKNNSEEENPDLLNGIQINWDPFLYSFLGGMVGYLVGLGLSELFPIRVVSKTEYNYPLSGDNIGWLKSLARYKY